MFYILPSIDNLNELLHPLLSQFNITRSQFLFLMGGYKVKSYLAKMLSYIACQYISVFRISVPNDGTLPNDVKPRVIVPNFFFFFQ